MPEGYPTFTRTLECQACGHKWAQEFFRDAGGVFGVDEKTRDAGECPECHASVDLDQ